MNNLNVRRGDIVVVLTGKDKGKKGKILTASPKNESVTVEGINMVTKHVKPRGAQKPGGMQKTPGNTHVSNVMLICPACSKSTRIAHTIVGDENLRTCKKCGAAIDKTAKASEAKKAAKKTVKADAADTKKKPARKAKAEDTAETVTADTKTTEKPKKATKADKEA